MTHSLFAVYNGIVAKDSKYSTEIIALIDTDNNIIETTKEFAKSIPSRNVSISKYNEFIEEDCDHFLI